MGIESADSVVLIKRKGKVAELRKAAFDADATGLDYEESLNNTVGIAHTRWATHGEPSEKNCHPQRYVMRASVVESLYRVTSHLDSYIVLHCIWEFPWLVWHFCS